MHEFIAIPNPRAFDIDGASGQGLFMVVGETVRRPIPARVERLASLARVSDALDVLKRKRDRYKSAGKLIEARTVQACMDEIRGVWK